MHISRSVRLSDIQRIIQWSLLGGPGLIPGIYKVVKRNFNAAELTHWVKTFGVGSIKQKITSLDISIKNAQVFSDTVVGFDFFEDLGNGQKSHKV